MDNIESTEPVGVEGATSSQDNSASDTQPTETTGSVSDGTVAEAGSDAPWSSDPKFQGKSAGDIYKAYQESQKVLGRLSQKAEIANLIEERYGVTPQELKSRLDQQAETQRQQMYQNNPVAPLYEKLQTLESKLALQEEEKRLDSFIKDNQAYAPFREKLMKLALQVETDMPYDEIAKEYFGQAIAQGQESAYKKIEVKQKTQAAGTSSVPQRSITLEDMKKMTSEELEAILPHA
jgi:hypothetical protein